jgi:VWFA-related protein
MNTPWRTRLISPWPAIACFIFNIALSICCGFGQTTATPSQEPPSKKRPPVEEQEPEVKGRTQLSVDVALVTMDVTVNDKKGNLVTGLKTENFEIYEDGVKQEIRNFAQIQAPMTVVLLIEYSRQVDWLVRDVLEAAYGFLRTLRNDDWCAIIGYDIRPTIITDFTQNKNQLYDGMRRFNFPAFSESNLSDAIYDTLDRVAEIEGRVAVLLISTGLDTFSKVTYTKALEKAKNSNASIYTISIGQTLRIILDSRGMMGNESRIEYLQADNRLRSFAKVSGGISFEPRFITEYPSIFKTISDFMRIKYSIGFVSSNTKRDSRYRKLRVEVVNVDLDRDGKPDKLVVTGREGYIAK